MNAFRHLSALALVFGLATTTLFAQGRAKHAQTGTEYWLKMEKELGLQTRYSVDMEMQAMGMTMQSKLHHLDSLTRTEMTMPFMNMRMVALQLQENGKAVSYSLFPDQKKYCVNPEGEEGEDKGKKPAFKITDAGTEVHEGVTCKKRHITVTMPDGQVQEMDMLFSPAQKNMPVKMTANVKAETQPGQPPTVITSVVLFKNYVFAAPAASLFAIPKDYTKAASMTEVMMGGMGGMPAPQPGAGQAGAGAQQQDLNALLRQAQEEAAKEAAAEAKQNAPATPPAAPNQDIQQGLQNLKRLFGN